MFASKTTICFGTTLYMTKYFTCAIYAINYADVPKQTELFCQITKMILMIIEKSILIKLYF